MSDAPERPEGVPDSAWWDESENEWILGEKDADDQEQGEYSYWRPDGTLCCKNNYVDGVLQGEFKRFHENGEVSQSGTFLDGELHGTRTWHSIDEPTTENTRPPGVSELVMKSEMDYVNGEVNGVRHFDRDGRRVMPNSGEPYPEPPDGVDPGAEYHPNEEQWAIGTADAEQNKQGLWRYWHADGAKKREIGYKDDVPHGEFRGYDGDGVLRQDGELDEGDQVGTWRSFDDDGVLSTETEYAGGSPHGAFRELNVAMYYRADGAAYLRGQNEEGEPTGRWELLSESDEILASVEIGVTPEDGAEVEALSNPPRAAPEWQTLADELFEEKRFAAGFAALARAIATSRDVTPFLAALESYALPTTEEKAHELFQESSDDGALSLLGRLVLGVSPSATLRALAVEVDQIDSGHAALDFVNAAILLEPDESAYLFTRILVLQRLGLKGHAEKDIEALAVDAPDQAEFLRTYNRLLYPTFDFWPTKEEPETYYDGLPDAPEQSLENIQKFIGKYARRLQLIRQALEKLVSPTMDWLPPDVSHLVPDDVSLDVDEMTLTDEDGDEFSIDIDETLDPDGAELPDLLRWARFEWNALTFLCWSAGLDDVGRPEALAAPEHFGAAAGMSLQRLWRCRDRRVTNGYSAQRSGVPSFDWEGIAIDELHPQFLSMAESQYAEMAALFRWLSDGENVSPWQDNLRGS
ncbi:MAG: thiol reductase thioredoxin [Myxococcota bacterium]